MFTTFRHVLERVDDGPSACAAMPPQAVPVLHLPVFVRHDLLPAKSLRRLCGDRVLPAIRRAGWMIGSNAFSTARKASSVMAAAMTRS